VIVSANLNRRNLTAGQRAMALAKIYPEPAKLKKKGAGGSSVAEERDLGSGKLWMHDSAHGARNGKARSFRNQEP
jgi:hypothetical protein